MPAKRLPKDAPRELDPSRRPWEKQPWESNPSYRAFALYRDLGLTRSLMKAATALSEDEGRVGKPESIKTQMAEWSSLGHWVARAEAYDMHVDERLREQREGRIGRQNRRYETASATLSSQLLRRIAGGDTEAGLIALDVNELDAEGAARMLVNLQRVERIATGQPTELVKGAFLISSADVERISRDLYEGLMQFIPQERQPLAAQWVLSYAQGGGKLGQ